MILDLFDQKCLHLIVNPQFIDFQFPGFIMYLIHVTCRVIVMAILAAYLKGLSLAILFLLAIPINFCLTRY